MQIKRSQTIIKDEKAECDKTSKEKETAEDQNAATKNKAQKKPIFSAL